MHIRILLFLIIFAFYPLPTFALVTNADKMTTQLIAGFYSRQQTLERFPVMLSSQDNGQTWSFLNNIPLSSNYQNISFHALECIGEICIAVGAFNNPAYPLILRTENAGKTWSYVTNIVGLPSPPKSYAIEDLSCYGNTCVAMGWYTAFDYPHFKPMILTSHDKGLSWRSIDTIENTSINGVIGNFLNNTTCTEGVCVGIYDKDNYQFNTSKPIVSHDQGNTWKYVNDIANLPENKGLVFGDLKCVENTCVAGGKYIPFSSNDWQPHPILIGSFNKGKTWSTIQNVLDLPSLAHGVILALTTNNKGWWFAAGHYRISGQENFRPLLLISKDEGQHWSFVKNITGLDESDITLLSVTCQKNDCIAGGGYTSLDNTGQPYTQPLFLTSHDYGDSFHRSNKIVSLPSKEARIKQIQCNESTCTAFGNYFEAVENSPPLILTSTDKGENWSFNSAKNLPEHVHAMELTTLSNISRDWRACSQ